MGLTKTACCKSPPAISGLVLELVLGLDERTSIASPSSRLDASSSACAVSRSAYCACISSSPSFTRVRLIGFWNGGELDAEPRFEFDAEICVTPARRLRSKPSRVVALITAMCLGPSEATRALYRGR